MASSTVFIGRAASERPRFPRYGIKAALSGFGTHCFFAYGRRMHTSQRLLRQGEKKGFSGRTRKNVRVLN